MGVAMGWARTLRLAQLLSEAIHAHAASQPSPAGQCEPQENPMDDTITTAPADAAPSTPAAPMPTSALGEFDGKLERVIEFVKILNDNPAIHSLLCALLGINTNTPAA
jgi:hypothetical protein